MKAIEIYEEKNFYPLIELGNYKKIPMKKYKEINKDTGKKELIDSVLIHNKIENERSFKNTKDLTGFALLCGEISNIMVIDLDVNHGSTDGFESFKEFISELSEEEKEIIRNTFQVRTPNGGIHLYFQYKKGLKNKANYLPGVDIRTEGGIIIMTGTKVKDRNGEIKEYKPLNNNLVEKIPKGLYEKFLKLDKKKKDNKSIIAEDKKKEEKSIFADGSRNDSLFKAVIKIISSSTIRDLNTIKDIARGLNQIKCVPPLEEGEIDKIIASIMQRLTPCYCDSKGNIKEWNLVNYILEQKPSYTKGNLWFMYNEKNGIYDYLESKDIQKMYFQYAINDKDKTALKSKKFADLLMLAAEDFEETHDEKKYINCKNGIIDIENNKLLKYDPKYKLQVQFNAKYDLNWKEQFKKSKFKKFLNTTLAEDDIKTLQQAIGLFLSPHAREVEKVFLFKGAGSNGKSVMFDIMESLIDKRYISGVGIGDFGQDFIISMMEGKYTNIVRDDDFERNVHKHFKSIATGEEVTVNRKNKDHLRLSFNLTMFFGLNGLPNSKDKSFGFFRRPIIIPFNNTFGNETEVREGKARFLKDVTIGKDIIENEKDIVFNWAYEGLKEVEKNNWNIEQSKGSLAEMEEYREETDTVYGFYKQCIVEEINNNIEARVLYVKYLNYCEDNFINMPVTSTRFGKQIKSFGIQSKRGGKGNIYLDIKVI